ncbi:uncharacterized protein LOC121371340 [Gigantopelta aegis]|uniref:uncharacterized protein LOC121371340 n=1 Tax=Gigantopelta aegis TaxID=1735272 RepID=UPI001B88C897|nr:uncharacterized protein LOC121371340 [Gigantopelta aegis]
MASNTTDPFLGESTGALVSVMITLTAIGTLANMISIAAKLLLKFALPDTWKYIIALLDISHLFLGLGLALLLTYVNNGINNFCHSAGFFILFGVLDTLFTYFLSAIILMFIQNPERLSGYSSYRKWPIPTLIIPQKIIFIFLSFIPLLPMTYFEHQTPFPIACFPLQNANTSGAGYGAVIVVLFWMMVISSMVLSLVCALRLWKSAKGRIHASSPNIWQLMMLGQGKTFQKFLLLEQMIWIVVLFMVTIVLYTNSAKRVVPQWIIIIAFSVLITLHAIFSNIQTILWSTLCCKTKQQAKEPHQKLKKLELLKIEGPGKLRMKATWSVGKGMLKHGLLKVYSLDNLKSWAQEIVILGMMRKIQNASLLQCLWTNNNNPYYDTMMLITGEIVTSDSRLICMEWTSSGTLGDFLAHLDIPLPEPCQKTIIHDIAEGLSCLHEQNILHQNLSSATVYLKGSLERLVLRAAIGDFENAQICGSLQSGVMSSVSNKKQFFLPDIRAFALVTLEIIGLVCDKRLEYIHFHTQGNSHDKANLQDMFCTETPRNYGYLESASENSVDDIPYFGTLINVKGQSPQTTELNQTLGHEAFRKPNVSSKDNRENSSTSELNNPGSVQLSRSNGMGSRTSIMSHKKRRAPDIPQKIPESPPISHESATPWQDGPSSHDYVDYPQTSFQSPRLDPADYNRQASGPVHKSYSFPQESIFKGTSLGDHNYEEIEEIAEEIERSYGKMGAPGRGFQNTSGLNHDHKFTPTEAAESGPRGQMFEPRSMHKSASEDQRTIYNSSGINRPMNSYGDHDRRCCSPSALLVKSQEEILPGMADDTQTSGPSLKELWLVREAKRKQYLIECYDERMKPMLRDMIVAKGGRPGYNRLIPDSSNGQMRPSNASAQKSHAYRQGYESGMPNVDHASTPVRPKTSVPSSAKMNASRPSTAYVPHRPQTAQATSIKKNKARTVLTRQLQRPATAVDKDRGKSASDVERKYASRKQSANVIHENGGNVHQNKEESCEFSQQTNSPDKTVQAAGNNVGKFSSFSSNDSFSSYFRNNPRTQQSTSLTSGELTSLSSQAYSSDHGKHDGYVTEHEPEYDIPVHKIQVSPRKDVKFDSGFDSGSVKSDDGSLQELEIDDHTCSCPTDEACSCQYSVSPTAGMHTQPIYPQSCTDNSFSSCERTPQHSRKDNFFRTAESDIIGPDQQYPSGRLESNTKKGINIKPVRKTRSKERIQWKRNMKRYKELITRGVPLRVSVVSASEHSETDRDSVMESTAEIIEEEEEDEEEEWDSEDEVLFQGLESQMPFINSDTESSKTQSEGRYSQKGSINRFHQYETPMDFHPSRMQTKRRKSNADVLDEIIRELPDEITGESSADETRAILDTDRGQSLPNRQHDKHFDKDSRRNDKPFSNYPLVDAEMAIDKMFTQQNNSNDNHMPYLRDPIFGLDEKTIQQLRTLSEGQVPSNNSGTVNVPLLKGMSVEHVRYCQHLSSKISFVNFEELLPARSVNFEVMKSKLQHAGRFGTIGNQLLETAQSCWLSDSPPSSAELVYRLTDTIAETEL